MIHDEIENEVIPTVDEIEANFAVLFRVIADGKPNDRSEKDRAFAIVKTELEKALAYYKVFCK